MPKYRFEGRLIRYYSDVIEADSIEEAIEFIHDDIQDYDEDFGPETEVDWISEVED